METRTRDKLVSEEPIHSTLVSRSGDELGTRHKLLMKQINNGKAPGKNGRQPGKNAR
jgi:hypothetical protein